MDGESSKHEKHEAILQIQISEPCDLSLHYLMHITENFSEKRELGRGGFGVVYKGVLRNGEIIAVKKLQSGPKVQEKQFMKEVNHLMKVKHQNIVRFVGYCYETKNQFLEYNGKEIFAETQYRLLCFEYMRNGSLDKYISEESCGLDWHDRYKIIKGVCCGLHYLHTECETKKPIIHLDLKPENILLDDNMVPKIADFGTSRLFDDMKTRTYATATVGSFGYMAPEYICNGLITAKADMFSLGVVIIQIITGKRCFNPFDPEMSRHDIIELVLQKWQNRLEAASRHTSLELVYKQIDTCLRIGFNCMEIDPTKRPTVNEIMTKLSWDIIDNHVIDEKTMPFSQDKCCLVNDCLAEDVKMWSLQERENNQILFPLARKFPLSF